jgi:hypothetical protein
MNAGQHIESAKQISHRVDAQGREASPSELRQVKYHLHPADGHRAESLFAHAVGPGGFGYELLNRLWVLAGGD